MELPPNGHSVQRDYHSHGKLLYASVNGVSIASRTEQCPAIDVIGEMAFLVSTCDPYWVIESWVFDNTTCVTLALHTSLKYPPLLRLRVSIMFFVHYNWLITSIFERHVRSQQRLTMSMYLSIVIPIIWLGLFPSSTSSRYCSFDHARCVSPKLTCLRQSFHSIPQVKYRSYLIRHCIGSLRQVISDNPGGSAWPELPKAQAVWKTSMIRQLVMETSWVLSTSSPSISHQEQLVRVEVWRRWQGRGIEASRTSKIHGWY